MGDSFYTDQELAGLGLAHVGRGVRLSKMTRLYGSDKISIGDYSRIDDFTVISADEPVTIGRNVHIHFFSGLFGSAGITMEDFSGLSSRVSVYTGSDDYSGEHLTNPTVPARFTGGARAAIVIARHAIVGTGAVLLPGASLGEGSSIGALSLVTRPIPAWSIAAGIPARVIKQRSRALLDMEAEYLTGDEA